MPEHKDNTRATRRRFRKICEDLARLIVVHGTIAREHDKTLPDVLLDLLRVERTDGNRTLVLQAIEQASGETVMVTYDNKQRPIAVARCQPKLIDGRSPDRTQPTAAITQTVKPRYSVVPPPRPLNTAAAVPPILLADLLQQHGNWFRIPRPVLVNYLMQSMYLAADTEGIIAENIFKLVERAAPEIPKPLLTLCIKLMQARGLLDILSIGDDWKAVVIARDRLDVSDGWEVPETSVSHELRYGPRRDRTDQVAALQAELAALEEDVQAQQEALQRVNKRLAQTERELTKVQAERDEAQRSAAAKQQVISQQQAHPSSTRLTATSG